MKVQKLGKRGKQANVNPTKSSDLNCLSANINIFAETRFSFQDTDGMYCIPGYELFRNDNSNSSNASRPYGGTAVYSKIPYLTGYPCCNNIHGIELTIIKIKPCGLYNHRDISLTKGFCQTPLSSN